MADNPAELWAVRASARIGLAAAMEAVWSEGHAALPLDEHVSDTETERLLSELRPARILELGEVRLLEGGVPVEPGTALVIPTSGTAGAAKGVELSHAALRAAAEASLQRLGATPGDPWLCSLPLGHVAGLMTLIRSRASGVEPLIREGFEPRDFAGSEAAFTSLVPTMLWRLLEEGVDLSGFKAILLGGSGSGPGLLQRARDRGANVVVTYGMTETCGGVVYDGTALEGTRVALDEDGLIRLGGPTLMNGYRLRPESTHAVLRDGWFRTSDVGSTDSAGRLKVLGRADDVIVTGGLKVHPMEVEQALEARPEVREALVSGEPDEEWGMRVVARVVPAGEVNPSRLIDVLKGELPGFKVPKEIKLVDALPRTEAGKPIRGPNLESRGESL